MRWEEGDWSPNRVPVKYLRTASVFCLQKPDISQTLHLAVKIQDEQVLIIWFLRTVQWHLRGPSHPQWFLGLPPGPPCGTCGAGTTSPASTNARRPARAGTRSRNTWGFVEERDLVEGLCSLRPTRLLWEVIGANICWYPKMLPPKAASQIWALKAGF